jgi:uncharacterized protein YdeI (YjbR/CyaY-like superfamily)
MAKTKTTKPEALLKKTSKLSGHEQVLEFIDQCDHPLRKVMEAAREIVLSANREITEHIKWNAPSFCFNGEDKVTFNLHSNEYLAIVFHTGAKVKDRKANGPLFEDTTGLLEWATNDRAIVKLSSMQDLDAKKDIFKKVVKQWIILTGE